MYRKPILRLQCSLCIGALGSRDAPIIRVDGERAAGRRASLMIRLAHLLLHHRSLAGLRACCIPHYANAPSRPWKRRAIFAGGRAALGAVYHRVSEQASFYLFFSLFSCLYLPSFFMRCHLAAATPVLLILIRRKKSSFLGSHEEVLQKRSSLNVVYGVCYCSLAGVMKDTFW